MTGLSKNCFTHHKGTKTLLSVPKKDKGYLLNWSSCNAGHQPDAQYHVFKYQLLSTDDLLYDVNSEIQQA